MAKVGLVTVSSAPSLKARQEILQRLLDVQEQYGEPLISEEEIRLIRELWTTEIAEKFSRGCDE